MKALCTVIAIAFTMNSCGKPETSTMKDSTRWEKSQLFEMTPKDARPGYTFSSELKTAGLRPGHYKGPSKTGCVVLGPKLTISSTKGYGQAFIELRASAWVDMYMKGCIASGPAGDKDVNCYDESSTYDDRGNVSVEFIANGRTYAQESISWKGDLGRRKIHLEPFTWSGDLKKFEIRVCTQGKQSPQRSRIITKTFEGEIEVFRTHFNASWNP